MTTWMHDLSTERIPTEWRLYHPVSGDETTVPNDGKLANLCKKLQFIDNGYLLDDTITFEVEDDDVNQS